MEPTWQTTITTKLPNSTKMRQSLTGPQLSSTARAITQRAGSIQGVLSNTPRVQTSKVIRPMQRANSKSN
jgi:hypothetical protein